MKYLFCIFLFVITTSIFSQKKDSLLFYYEVNEYILNSNDIIKLNTLINELDRTKNYNIEIQSSADGLGSKTYNKKLIEKRISFIKQIIDNYTINYKLSTKNNGQPKGLKIKKNSKYRKSSLFISEINDDSDNISAKNIKIGDKFILENIYFYLGSTRFIKKKSQKSLNELVLFLKKNPNINIKIIEHRCCGRFIGEKISKKEKKMNFLF